MDAIEYIYKWRRTTSAMRRLSSYRTSPSVGFKAVYSTVLEDWLKITIYLGRGGGGGDTITITITDVRDGMGWPGMGWGISHRLMRHYIRASRNNTMRK